LTLAVPVPTIVIILPDIVATDGVRLSYENVPKLLDEGSVIVIGPTPKTTFGNSRFSPVPRGFAMKTISAITHGLIMGLMGETANNAVTEPAE
jgi:hypothetical protein